MELAANPGWLLLTWHRGEALSSGRSVGSRGGGLEKGEIHVTAEDKKIRDLRRSFALPTRQLKIDQKKNPKVLFEMTAPTEESGANFIHLNILK